MNACGPKINGRTVRPHKVRNSTVQKAILSKRVESKDLR